jgi:hypothetical protein
MNSGIWTPYVWPALHPADSEEIHCIESLWNIMLPQDYKKVAAIYQGCSPCPNGVKVGDGATGLGILLTVSVNRAKAYESVQWAYERAKEHIPAGLYPFARSIGSDDFFFDYRQDSHRPRVIFFYPEEEGEDAIISIADSFTQFINRLTE